MPDSRNSDQTRLLRVEIFLKVYMLVLVLVGCLFLQLTGFLTVFKFPVGRLGATLFVFVALNAIYLYLLKQTDRLGTLYIWVGVSDILFFTVIIHYLGGMDSPVLALLYLLPVPFFSILISPSAGYLLAIGGCVSLGFLSFAEYSGIIGYYGNQLLYLEKIGVVLFFVLFCFVSYTFYIGYFADVLKRHQRALSEANRQIEKQNLNLEERIRQRTRELEEAQGKLQQYSRQLERAYNEKNMQLEEVQKRLETSLGELKLKYNYDKIIGRSLKMQEILRLVDKVTDFSVSILIQGESGTGKELVAKAIHYNGPRKDRPFVIQNCSAITDTLLESELFGHVKGAFTGAYQDRKGLFEEADQGTLFLDEIGDMSPAMQAKLLRVIQEGEVRRVGGKHVIQIDVRIISATNRYLKNSVETGYFREDLYYRLNGVTIQLPPLRERRDDVLLLAECFLDRFCKETGIEHKTLSPEAEKILYSYAWPGNVRELENTIKHACVISQDQAIKADDFRYKPELFGKAGGKVIGGKKDGVLSPADSQKEAGNSGSKVFPTNQEGIALKSLRQTEREAIENALRLCHGKRKEAAKILNIPVRTLYEKVKRYGIE